MAKSPAHQFGELVGKALEEIIAPLVKETCEKHGFYLDMEGSRTAREGRTVTWEDVKGNKHNLDLVIEENGSDEKIGEPRGFIEVAWRRYSRHARNKVQEIDAAVTPVAEKFSHFSPFLGAFLAGGFTPGSITQLKSRGFSVVLFPYDSIVTALENAGVKARFNEDTYEKDFLKATKALTGPSKKKKWRKFEETLFELHKTEIQEFLKEMKNALLRRIEKIIVIPLHGVVNEFHSLKDAKKFIQNYDGQVDIPLRKFEILITYSNGDSVDGKFESREKAIEFVQYFTKG